MKCPYIVPRSFHLLEELTMAEKAKYPKEYKEDTAYITLGLTDPHDSYLTHWSASIIPSQAVVIGDRIYSLKIRCHRDYPEEPPQVCFVQRVCGTKFIDSRGNVNVSMLMGKWKRTFLLMDILIALRSHLATTAKLHASIPASATYSSPAF